MTIKLTTYDFIKKSNIVHDFKYDYSKSIYTNSETKIEIICPTHGSFFQRAGAHLFGSGCKLCADNKLLKTANQFINKANSIHGNKYDYSKMILNGMNNNITIICPIHGEFQVYASNHISKLKQGCQKCSNYYRRTIDDFIQDASEIHNNKYDYSLTEFITVNDKIKIICPIHGIFVQYANNHLLGRGCKYCSLGGVSKKEQQWLDFLNLPNDTSHRNVLIVIENRRFFVDGHIPGTNIIYEFLGDFWHGHPKLFNPNNINPYNKKSFGQLFNETIDRIRFLRSNGYKVISIWEHDFMKL